NRLRTGNRKFPAGWQRIEIRDAVFRYGDMAAVGPLTLEIKRGEIVGIAGSSGSGKSTVVKLLLGLYHVESGSVQIGDATIEEIAHEDLTANMAVALQETELFHLSLRDNITMMRDTSPELLRRACEIACLTDVIARLPNGLDSMIGERGYSLSGGERQRVG